MNVYMKWTRKKAVNFFADIYKKQFLDKLTEKELFDLGVKKGFWEGECSCNSDKEKLE